MIERQRLLLRRLPVAVLLMSLAGCGTTALPPMVDGADCHWRTTVETWRDDNRDGRRQAEEPALEGVTIMVQGDPDVRARGVTDGRGIVQLAPRIGGCFDAELVVEAIPPAGYTAITSTLLPVQYDLPEGTTIIAGRRFDQQAGVNPVTLSFGFVED